MKIKEVIWLYSTRKNLKTFPEEVRNEVGYALYAAQCGEKSSITKKYKSMPGVMEIVSDFNKETYRAVYTFKIENCIYVLHCFHKKSKKDNKIPKNDKKIIEDRYKEVLDYVRKQKSKI